MRRGRLVPALIFAAALAGSGAATHLQAVTGSPFVLVDVHVAAGVDVVTWHGRPDKPHILESGGAGAALLDYDGDGDLDLYVVNGWRLEGAEIVERGANVLYRNRGDGTFDDVTAEAGVGDDGWGTAATVGDIDGDGRPDLFVSNFGPDVLYRNLDGSRFEPLERTAGIDGWSSSAVLFDADGDADQDLFVTGYIDASLDEVLQAKADLLWRGVPVMRGPFGLEGLANRYFVNRGGDRFEEATIAAGLQDVGLFYSFGVVAVDLDNDGLTDLYVANDSNPNYLYQNQGGGRFAEVGLWSGAALDRGGMAQAGMGIAAGDYDADGRVDLFVTHFAEDHSTLYHNLGDMGFGDVTEAAGLVDATWATLSWGTVLADFDLDGDLDLFIANGHIYPQADTNPQAVIGFAQANQVMEQRDGVFFDVSSDSGPGLEVMESSRGVAAGDIDNDGDVDLVVVNVDAPPSVLRNDSSRRGRWLIVDAASAAWVEVRAGGRVWRRQRIIGGSYASSGDPRFHFGLGPVRSISEVRVGWADGQESVQRNVAPDQILLLLPDTITP